MRSSMTNFMGNTEDMTGLVTASLVARKKKYLYPLSLDTVRRMCREKTFKTAIKLGPGKRAHWFISPVEIMQYKLNRNAIEL